MAHTIVKPEVLVRAAIGMLEQELVIPKLFQLEGIDRYKGAENDSVSIPVEGVLPFHTYAWRNDRSQPIVFDTYTERKITVAFGGNEYSAIHLTDEQSDMDIESWIKLLAPQAKAVARGLARKAVTELTGASYNVTIANTALNLRGALIEARRVLDAFHAPSEGRYFVCGSSFEAALLADDKLNLASNVGEDMAASAFGNAVIGRRYGFTIIKALELPANAAYAFARSGFIMTTAAPSVPASIPYGATTSFEGLALRWIRDYDSLYLRDRSVVNAYAGFRAVEDVLVGWDEINHTEVVSTGEHFVRGIKLTLDGVASIYPEIDSELATMTGISAAAPWTPLPPLPPG